MQRKRFFSKAKSFRGNIMFQVRFINSIQVEWLIHLWIKST